MQTIGSEFVNNVASWGGGVEFKMSVFACSKSHFSRNRAKFDGGALNCQNSTVDVMGCRFSSNVGDNNAGGFWLDGSVLTATESTWDGNSAKSRDGGGIFALNTDSKIRNCILLKNNARRGANLYNHGGDANVFCRFIPKTYNRPKVNGHITQDCFICPAGKWGDFENAGSALCEEQCAIDKAGHSLPCYDCPYELACDGQRHCKEGYRGEQCMECKPGNVKLGSQCLPLAAAATVVLWAAVMALVYMVYLAKGPVLDANQFARLKILSSLFQLLIMVGKVHGAFGGQTEVFIAFLMPISLWLDASPMMALGQGNVSFIAVHVVNILFPVAFLLVLLQLQNHLYHKRIYFTSSNVSTALSYLKHERRISQFTLLLAELSYVPVLYNAAAIFYCYRTSLGPDKLLVSDPSMRCTGPGFQALRGLSVAAFVLVGVVFPLVLR